VRLWLFLVAAALAWPVGAQETAPKKKTVAKQKAHKKPTPEQIRKFKELEKKQK
jgi:hypothetical protein